MINKLLNQRPISIVLFILCLAAFSLPSCIVIKNKKKYMSLVEKKDSLAIRTKSLEIKVDSLADTLTSKNYVISSMNFLRKISYVK